MKKCVAYLLLVVCLQANAQFKKDIKTIKQPAMAEKVMPVTLYENSNYSGRTKALSTGSYLLSDFNDIASSVRVSPGWVIAIYESGNAQQGYGKWVDLLEDQANLADFGFDNIATYVNVFPAKADVKVYIRSRMENGQFIPGHWERQKANGSDPLTNHVVVVSPSVAPPIVKTETVLQYNGPVTTITTLGNQNDNNRYLWERADQQLGVIGNDFRGVEIMGSACFQRESHNRLIPDYFNFWYLQKQKNDHRDHPYFKRTLVGKLEETKQFNIAGTFQDYDVSLYIKPDPAFQYLLTDAHPKEYTSIMSLQWNASKISTDNLTRAPWNWEGSSGTPDCDNTEEDFERIEAEIATDYWPQGDHLFGRSSMADLALNQVGDKVAVYGPWVYDAGHCCHPEIHPFEQSWWKNRYDRNVYHLNVVCDASERFWWRSQMDDGEKLHPWAAPPIKGLFAIAFSVPLPDPNQAFGKVTMKYEVANLFSFNVKAFPGTDQTYKLMYQGRPVVIFQPHNDAFRVSFENVGQDGNNIRGFLVIETSVGTTTQVATSLNVPVNGQLVHVNIPSNSDPDKIDQRLEKFFFKKVAGNYMFKVKQSVMTDEPVMGQ